MVFGLLKVYPTLISSLGLSKIMYFHAGCLVFGLVFVQFWMPETRGLTMTQISAVFGGANVSSQSGRKGDKEAVAGTSGHEDCLLQEQEDSSITFSVETKA